MNKLLLPIHHKKWDHDVNFHLFYIFMHLNQYNRCMQYHKIILWVSITHYKSYFTTKMCLKKKTQFTSFFVFTVDKHLREMFIVLLKVNKKMKEFFWPSYLPLKIKHYSWLLNFNLKDLNIEEQSTSLLIKIVAFKTSAIKF